MANEKYAFTKETEALIVYFEATSPRFHALIGSAIDANRINNSIAATLIQAAKAVYANTPSGCTSTALALQHLRWLVECGKITYETLQQATDFFNEIEPINKPDIESFVSTIAPVIRNIMHRETIEQVIQDYGKGEDAQSVAQKFDKIASIGKRRASIGKQVEFSEEEFIQVADDHMKHPLPVGVPELDVALGGGLEQGTLGLVMGGTGGGKSLMLCHIAAEALIQGYDVAYMTLEISENEVKRRLFSNLSGMTRQEIGSNPKLAVERSKSIVKGSLVVCYQPPKVTTVSFVKSWVKDIAREFSINPKAIVIDFADKLVSEIGSDRRTYEEMEIVYDHLRDFASEINGWVWTASHIQGGHTYDTKLNLDHVSDSKHKVRNPDLVIALVRSEQDCEDGMISFRILKRRSGTGAHIDIGPMPWDAERGRIALVYRQEPWR